MPQQECLEGWLGWNCGPRCFLVTSPGWWPQISYVIAQSSESQSSREGGRSPKAFLTQAAKSPSVTSNIIYWLKQSPTCPDSRGKAVEHTSRGEGFQRICAHVLELPQCSPLTSSCLLGEKHSHHYLARRPTECAGTSSLVFEDKENHMFWGQQREQLFKVTW